VLVILSPGVVAGRPDKRERVSVYHKMVNYGFSKLCLKGAITVPSQFILFKQGWMIIRSTLISLIASIISFGSNLVLSSSDRNSLDIAPSSMVVCQRHSSAVHPS